MNLLFVKYLRVFCGKKKEMDADHEGRPHPLMVPELIAHVLSFLPDEDWGRSQQVCRTWRNAVSHTDWKERKDKAMDKKISIYYEKFCQEKKALVFPYYGYHDYRFLEYIFDCGDIEMARCYCYFEKTRKVVVNYLINFNYVPKDADPELLKHFYKVLVKEKGISEAIFNAHWNCLYEVTNYLNKNF